MSFTRFHDDSARIQKQMEQMTYSGRYQLDVPGPGAKMPFQDDAQIRMQKWGANLQTNVVGLENDLKGLTRKLGRDHIEHNDYTKTKAESLPIAYERERPFVEESRASHPAWMYRDLEQPVWENRMTHIQGNLEKPFHDNIQTRILEKDYYRPKTAPTLHTNVSDPFSLDYYIDKNDGKNNSTRR